MTFRHALSQPMLSAEDEHRLVLACKAGDASARDTLVTSHMRLCYAVAARYSKNEEHVRDLAQEGVFGLFEAIDRFDPERGTRLATYARWWISNEIRKAVARVSLTVDMPARTFRRARKGVSEGEGSEWAAREAARGEIPLDAPVSADGETTVIDLLPCSRPDPEAAAIEKDRGNNLKRSVEGGLANAMSPREASVLRQRALAEHPRTLEDIAQDLGISRERVRQIEDKATKKLRRYLTASGFARSLLR